jgi:hypothetical protein
MEETPPADKSVKYSSSTSILSGATNHVMVLLSLLQQ